MNTKSIVVYLLVLFLNKIPVLFCKESLPTNNMDILMLQKNTYFEMSICVANFAFVLYYRFWDTISRSNWSDSDKVAAESAAKTEVQYC